MRYMFSPAANFHSWRLSCVFHRRIAGIIATHLREVDDDGKIRTWPSTYSIP